MKIRIFALAMALFFSLPAMAAVKIAVIDIQRAFKEVDEGKKAQEQLKSEFKRKQGELDKERNQIQGLFKDFQSNEMLYTPDVKAQKRKALQERMVKFQAKGQKLQGEMDKNQSQLLAKILGRIKVVLKDFGKKKKYEVILRKDTVLYSPGHFDITNEVIRMYNKKFPLKKKKKK